MFYDDLTEENKSKIMRVSDKIKFSQINTDDYNLISYLIFYHDINIKSNIC